MASAPNQQASIRAFRRSAGIAAIVCLPLLGLYFLLKPGAAMQSYLFSFMFWLSISAGSLGLLLLHQLTGGNWGRAVRPALMAAATLIPLTALLFIPIALGSGWIYKWADPAIVRADETLQKKAIYLNQTGFIIRAAIAFAIWLFFLWQVRRNASRPTEKRHSGFGAAGTILFVLTMTFCAVDWFMSLEPHWHSPIYGLMVIAGQALLAMAVAISFSYSRLSTDAVRQQVKDSVGDVANILLTLLMFWAYLAFSQYLIIWSANITEEITFYVHRSHAVWYVFGWGLILAHFLVPFLFLLNHRTKRNLRRLAIVAAAIVVMRLMNATWLILPAYQRTSVLPYAFDVLAFVAIGAIWVYACLVVFERDARRGMWTAKEATW